MRIFVVDDEKEIAEQVQLEKNARHSNWTFDDWLIPNGAVLEYVKDPSIECIVFNRRKVEFNGEILYMTPLARKITGNKSIVHGPGWVAQNFKYQGELIEDIEKGNYKLITIEEALSNLETITIDEETYNKVKNGSIIEKTFSNDIANLVYENKIVAIYQTYHSDNTKAKPFKMFIN